MNLITKKIHVGNSINVFRFLTQNNVKKSIDVRDVEHHSKLKELWWKSDGPLKPLHSLNPIRVSYVVNELINLKKVEPVNIGTQHCIKGIKILDVGCGGGIFTEGLARLEGNVTGIDPSEELISIANDHSMISKNKNIKYFNETVDEHVHLNAEAYDVVVSSEVVEHVVNKYTFLTNCVACLKPGGSLFITTPNRTLYAWLTLILYCETFNIIPKNTHNLKNFIRPHELQSILETNCKCKTVSIKGISYNPFKNQWTLTDSKRMAYAIHLVKNVI